MAQKAGSKEKYGKLTDYDDSLPLFHSHFEKRKVEVYHCGGKDKLLSEMAPLCYRIFKHKIQYKLRKLIVVDYCCR